MTSIVSQPKILAFESGDTAALVVSQTSVVQIVSALGTPGADGTSFTPRGPWDSGTTYAVGDVVSFDGGNYILYASPPTGGDPDVDTAHWDVFGSSSVPDGTTSVKGIVQLEDSHTSTSTTKAATPKNVKEAYDLAAAAQPADSDLTAIAGATLTGDGYLKRASSVWSLDTPSGGGGSLPSPTGEVGAVLGVDESETYALQRYIQYVDGDAYAVASVQTDRVRLEAADGLGGIAGVNVYMDGSVGIEATGPVTINTVEVDVSGAATDDVLAFDGTKFAPAAPSGGGGGGLVLIDSGTFSASSGFNVDSVFDGTYDNYRLLIAPLDHSTSSQIRMQFRAAGSTISGSNYDTQYFYAFGTSAAPGTDDGSTSFNIATLASDGVISFDIFQPAVARKTVMTGLRFSYQGDVSDFVLTSNGWVHHLTTAYDGFRLFPTSGTFTGSWALYGYAK